MLNEVLFEINNANGPLSLNVLSQRLGVDRSALDGMLRYWVRKGRLKDDDVMDVETAGGSCPSCGGAGTCSYVVKMPKSYSVPVPLVRETEQGS